MKHDKNPLFRPTPVVGGSPLEPEEQPVCTKSEQCEGCPYPAHGFICWRGDGACMRTEMAKIREQEKRK